MFEVFEFYKLTMVPRKKSRTDSSLEDVLIVPWKITDGYVASFQGYLMQPGYHATNWQLPATLPGNTKSRTKDTEGE